MKKKWLIFFISVAMIGSCIVVIDKTMVQSKPYIAVVLKSSNSEYWRSIEVGAKTALKNLGVKGNVYIFGKTVNEQKELLNKILKEKPAALIVSSVNPPLTVPILKEYHQQHVPVLLIDKEINWPYQTSFIGADNELLGEKAGELLSSMLQPGDKVAVFGMSSDLSNSNNRLKGAAESLSAAGMNIVMDKKISINNANLQSIMKSLFKNNRDLKGVFAANDQLAIKVLQLSKKEGLDVSVIGTDGTTEILKSIQKGDLEGSISPNPFDIGYLSVDYALKAITGKKIEKKINSGVDIITKDNVDNKLNFLEDNLASDPSFFSEFH